MLELGSEGPQCSLPPPRHCNCAAAADKGTQELRSVAEYKTKASHRLPPIINLFCFSAGTILCGAHHLAETFPFVIAIAVFVSGKEERNIHGTETLRVKAGKLRIHHVRCKIHVALPLY